jgi:signal transduction histidine kinase
MTTQGAGHPPPSAAADLARENARLEEELRARVAELEASRAKAVEAAMAERRSLERDLHDGAQQRLVALSLQLGIVQARLAKDPAAAGEALQAARSELALALEELRELARGIHPAILTDRGLGPALEALADRAPLPVELSEMPEERLPSCVESTAYFLVAESLTNIARHAGAHVARIKVSCSDGRATVEVRDDGIGGADPAGKGLQGLADRLSAIDGSLEVISPTGRGTIIRAEMPCA